MALAWSPNGLDRMIPALVGSQCPAEIVTLEVQAHRAQTARMLFRARASMLCIVARAQGYTQSLITFHPRQPQSPGEGGPVSMFRPATRRQNRYTEYPGAVCPRDAPPCRWLRTRGSSRTFPQVSCRRLMRVPPHRHQIRLLTNRTVSIHWRALLPPCFGCGGRAPITLIAARLQHLRRWLPNPAEDLRDRIAPRPCCPGHAPSSPKGTRPPLGLPVPA